MPPQTPTHVTRSRGQHILASPGPLTLSSLAPTTPSTPPSSVLLQRTRERAAARAFEAAAAAATSIQKQQVGMALAAADSSGLGALPTDTVTRVLGQLRLAPDASALEAAELRRGHVDTMQLTRSMASPLPPRSVASATILDRTQAAAQLTARLERPVGYTEAPAPCALVPRPSASADSRALGTECLRELIASEEPRELSAATVVPDCAWHIERPEPMVPADIFSIGYVSTLQALKPRTHRLEDIVPGTYNPAALVESRERASATAEQTFGDRADDVADILIQSCPCSVTAADLRRAAAAAGTPVKYTTATELLGGSTTLPTSELLASMGRTTSSPTRGSSDNSKLTFPLPHPTSLDPTPVDARPRAFSRGQRAVHFAENEREAGSALEREMRARAEFAVGGVGVGEGSGAGVDRAKMAIAIENEIQSRFGPPELVDKHGYGNLGLDYESVKLLRHLLPSLRDRSTLPLTHIFPGQNNRVAISEVENVFRTIGLPRAQAQAVFHAAKSLEGAPATDTTAVSRTALEKILRYSEDTDDVTRCRPAAVAELWQSRAVAAATRPETDPPRPADIPPNVTRVTTAGGLVNMRRGQDSGELKCLVHGVGAGVDGGLGAAVAAVAGAAVQGVDTRDWGCDDAQTNDRCLMNVTEAHNDILHALVDRDRAILADAGLRDETVRAARQAEPHHGGRGKAEVQNAAPCTNKNRQHREMVRRERERSRTPSAAPPSASDPSTTASSLATMAMSPRRREHELALSLTRTSAPLHTSPRPPSPPPLSSEFLAQRIPASPAALAATLRRRTCQRDTTTASEATTAMCDAAGVALHEPAGQRIAAEVEACARGRVEGAVHVGRDLVVDIADVAWHLGRGDEMVRAENEKRQAEVQRQRRAQEAAAERHAARLKEGEEVLRREEQRRLAKIACRPQDQLTYLL